MKYVVLYEGEVVETCDTQKEVEDVVTRDIHEHDNYREIGEYEILCVTSVKTLKEPSGLKYHWEDV